MARKPPKKPLRLDDEPKTPPEETPVEQIKEAAETLARKAGFRLSDIRWGRVFRRTAAIAAAILLLLTVFLTALNTPAGRRLVVQFATGIKLNSGLQFQIDRIDGSLYGKMTIHGLRVVDTKGVFIEAPVVNLDWRPFGYLNKHVDIRDLDAPRIEVLRQPVLNPSQEPEKSGLILPDLTNPFFPSLAQVVIQAARAHGYSVFLTDTEGSAEEEQRAVNLLVDHGVDGVIWFPIADDGPVGKLIEGVPTVVLDRNLPGYDVIQADYADGGRLARGAHADADDHDRNRQRQGAPEIGLPPAEGEQARDHHDRADEIDAVDLPAQPGTGPVQQRIGRLYRLHGVDEVARLVAVEHLQIIVPVVPDVLPQADQQDQRHPGQAQDEQP